MKIRHFLYNAFLIEDNDIKIAIDPGQNMWLFNPHSLIPKKEWESITHVLVTHGDPDHYWQADRVANTANAPLIMNTTMAKRHGSETDILAPRCNAVNFVPFSGNLLTLQVGETIETGGVKIQGIRTTHDPIEGEGGLFYPDCEQYEAHAPTFN